MYRLRFTAQIVREDHSGSGLPPLCTPLGPPSGGVWASDQTVSVPFMRDATARKMAFETLADELTRKALPALEPYIDLDLKHTK